MKIELGPKKYIYKSAPEVLARNLLLNQLSAPPITITGRQSSFPLLLLRKRVQFTLQDLAYLPLSSVRVMDFLYRPILLYA